MQSSFSKSEKEIFGRDFFFSVCVFLCQRMGYALCVIVMSHHAAAAVSVSTHELISIPPPPPLISLGHLEKVERGRQREREWSFRRARSRYIESVRLCCFGMLIKLRGGTEMATAAPRGALKSKQLYPGFLRGVREKCACLSSSLQTRVHRLPPLR